tara:strand:- start:575 stop:1000 length:426 start_codon:yes stop_codon:yes gene_type:complete
MDLFRFFTNNRDYKTNFEHVQYAIKHPTEYYIVNTLPLYEQNCLIKNTIHAGQEEVQINDMVYNVNVPDKKIIVYGKHSNDESVDTKYQQLIGIGLVDVYVYTGGIFEWLLLQDIYGATEFPTTETVLDILKFRPIVTISK